jgi:hypothetical protein
LLPKLFKRKCGQRIPRSGEEGEKVNCYSVALDSQNTPFLLLKNYEVNTLEGFKWNGRQYEEKYSINLLDIDNYDFRVFHYYGLDDVYYDSIYTLAFNYLTRLKYIKIILYRKFSSVDQYFFNKKKLITRKRMELLQFMVDIQLDSSQNTFDSLNLMTKLYSIKWVLHPSADSQRSKLEIYMDSLVASGELKREGMNYILTGKAIQTLENYEEEERRHVARVKLQRRLIWLTLILVFIGLVQSGIIKLPTLLNLSGK